MAVLWILLGCKNGCGLKRLSRGDLDIGETAIPGNRERRVAMEELKLYESEYRFMDLVWEKQPVRSTELARLAAYQLGWKLYGAEKAGGAGIFKK